MQSHFHILESFQAAIGKRILGVSKYYSNTSTLIELHWPSVKARVFIRKLTFLAKLLERDDVLSSRVFRTLASTNVYEISLVQQCRVLEQQIGTGYLQLCLQNPTIASSIVRICISSSYPEHLFTKHLTDYNVATVVTWLEDKYFNNLIILN